MARQLSKLPITTLDASTYFAVRHALSIDNVFYSNRTAGSALVGFETFGRV
jgi:hypothetical protein